jgi:hypothetical protein
MWSFGLRDALAHRLSHEALAADDVRSQLPISVVRRSGAMISLAMP